MHATMCVVVYERGGVQPCMQQRRGSRQWAWPAWSMHATGGSFYVFGWGQRGVNAGVWNGEAAGSGHG
jgi:hypothetical protein